jgi:hypothetical protein
MIKPRHTRRKFYGKWLYKITVRVPGISIFRLKSIPDLILFCVTADPEETYYGYGTKDKAWQNRKDIKLVAELLGSWDSTAWAKRIESNSMDIYTNDVDKYNEAIQKLSTLVASCYEPNLLYSKELSSSSNIVVKKYPHKIYRHKVYLMPHKIDTDLAVRQHYLDWLESQNPRILITEAVKNWFLKTHWNWDRRYVLVEDQQTLLLLKLRNPEVMGKVYDYVLADK